MKRADSMNIRIDIILRRLSALVPDLELELEGCPRVAESKSMVLNLPGR